MLRMVAHLNLLDHPPDRRSKTTVPRDRSAALWQASCRRLQGRGLFV